MTCSAGDRRCGRRERGGEHGGGGGDGAGALPSPSLPPLPLPPPPPSPPLPQPPLFFSFQDLWRADHRRVTAEMLVKSMQKREVRRAALHVLNSKGFGVSKSDAVV
jgi:hypothetical protein